MLYSVLSYIDFTLRVDSFSGKETIECRAILLVFAINFLRGAMQNFYDCFKIVYLGVKCNNKIMVLKQYDNIISIL